jgi:hypothetical protein
MSPAQEPLQDLFYSLDQWRNVWREASEDPAATPEARESARMKLISLTDARNILANAIPMNVVNDYIAEHKRQEARFPQQHLPNGEDTNYWKGEEDAAKMRVTKAVADGNLTWQLVLNEEVCEVFAEPVLSRKRVELTQVMAVAGRWIEDIDRQTDVNDE